MKKDTTRLSDNMEVWVKAKVLLGLKETVERLRGALAFYENEENYKMCLDDDSPDFGFSAIDKDKGAKAEDALRDDRY